MAEWDDAPLVSPDAQVARVQSITPTTGGSPWDAAPISGARSKAAVNANASADEAGKALSISKQTGIPASIVQTDLPGYDAHAKTQAAIQAVKNPAIAKYVDENRMAPQVSNDDYSTLDKISSVFSRLSKEAIDHATTLQLAEQTPLGEMASTEPGREKLRGYAERMRAGFAGGFGEGNEVERMFNDARKLGLSEQTIRTWEYSGLIPAARAVEAGLRGVPGLIGGAVGLASSVVEEGTGSVAWGDRLLREAPGLNVALMGAGVTGAQPKFGPANPVARVLAKQDDLHQFVAEHTPGGPRAKALSAGETPKDELWQAKPIIDQAKAETAGEALDEAVTASQESKTRERSPELYEKYLEAHGDQGTVHVPAQAILDLYEREGKVPLDGDGLFGFVPGLADKATLAAETGAEIKIPLSKYVAHVDEAVHEGLKNVVRVQENGVTREEAKLAKEEQAAKIEAYHGTPHDFESFDLSKIGTGEGAQVYGHGLYFAENKTVATEYQKNLSQNAQAGEQLTIQFLNNKYWIVDEMGAKVGPFDTKLEAVKAQEPGQLYKVHINADPTHFLDWDKPLSEQPQPVQDFITEKMKLRFPNSDLTKFESTGDIYKKLEGFGTAQSLSKEFAEAGIPGIKYLDQGSRDTPSGIEKRGNTYGIVSKDGQFLGAHGAFDNLKEAQEYLDSLSKQTRNFVVFDDKLVRIIEKNDNPIVQAAVERTAANEASLGISKADPFLSTIFEDGKAAGITEAEFKRYSDLIDRGQEAVLTKAVALAQREAAKRLTPEWRANEERISGEVEKEITRSPTYLADRYFNFDKGMLPNNKRILSDFFIPMDLAKADEWAPIFGFDSGAEMTAAVLAREGARTESGKGPKWQLKQEIEAETGARMEAQYGKLADNIALEASEAALAEHNVDLLAAEVKMLAKLNNREPPLGREELTSWVRAQFDKSTASEVSYEQWRRASEKGGREAEKALLKKDYEEAFIAKQKQMLSFILAREAKGFEKEMNRVNSTLVRLQDNRVLSTVEQEYTDQLHQLIDQLGFKNPRAPNELASALGGKTLKDFIGEKQGVGGEMPVADFLQTGRPVDFDKLTVNEMRALSDSLDTILHNGREAKTIRVGEEKRDRLQTIAEAVNQVADVDPKIISRDGGILADMRKNATAFDSMMLKMEQLLRWMDKRDKFGVYSQAVFRGISDAKHHENDLLAEIGKDIKAIREDKDWRNKLDTQIPNTYPSLLDWQTSEPMVLRRKDMLMMMAHSGNESNHGKMTSEYTYNNKVYKWEPDDVAQVIADHATKQDWDHVQAWWNIFDKYWPQIEGLARRMSGIAPDKIESRSFTNDHGTYKGGYVPVGADHLWPGIPKVEQGVFNSDRYFNAIPPKGYLQTRTNAGYPVSLAFDNLTNTMRQMAHDLAYREPLTNAAKFLDNDEVRGAIHRTLGPEYLRQVRPWLEYQATAKSISDESVGAMDSLARSARQRIVAVQLLYRFSTMVKHGAAAGLYSVGEVGVRPMISETMRLWGTADGRARVQEIMAESGELRHRLHNMDRDLGENMDRNMGDSGARATVEHYGGMGTSIFDLGTAVPTYEVAKKNALLEGKSEADAIYAGESAVRDAHGSSGTPDLAPIMRANEMYKLFTIAYGTFNHNYNRLRDAGRLYKEAGEELAAGDRLEAWNKFQSASWRSLWYIFLVAAVEESIQPIPEKEGEHSGALMWSAKALFHQLSGTIPVLREAARSYLYRGKLDDTGQTPMGQVIGSAAKAGKSLWEHDFDKKNAIKNTIEGTGYVLKLPGMGQLSQTLQYVQDLKTGRQTGENPYRFGRGILMGKSHPERK